MRHTDIPLVTAVAAIILATMQIALMNYVAFGREKYAVGLGDGGEDALRRRIRMHGNLAENAPIFLILLGLVETTGDWKFAAPVVAGAFVLARIAHVVGLHRSSGASVPRMVGALGTTVGVAALALFLAISIAARTMQS